MAETGGYLTVKLARELYRKPPQALAEAEQAHVATVAARQLKIEARILAAPEAAGVVLPEAAVERMLVEIRSRYVDRAEFEADLAAAGLGETELRAAVGRDLKVEAVLEQVASQSTPVTDTDVEIFYLMHKERFRRPEMRRLRHILVTINDGLPGSERAAARAKIEAIRARLLKVPERFEEQAIKHSECPTAMQGGLLGRMPRGQLYAELEPAAFALAAGELSAVVESPLGFHLLRCDAAEPAAPVPLGEVRERVREHLADSRRRQAQKAWIAGLFARG